MTCNPATPPSGAPGLLSRSPGLRTDIARSFATLPCPLDGPDVKTSTTRCRAFNEVALAVGLTGEGVVTHPISQR